jgi:hypothetical protein
VSELKLGLAQGYWGAAPNPNFVEMAQEAERLGFDSVWSAEAWGNDAFTPLCWIGAQTEKITDDVEAALLQVKYFMSFYIGGMGAKSTNFHYLPAHM